MNSKATDVQEASQKYGFTAAKPAVPAGYKQTEVGMIPEDWDCKILGDLGQVVRGGSPRPAGSPKYFNGSYIPWLTVASLTNIPESQQVVKATSSMLTELGSKHSRVLDEDTLIISNSGATLGVAKILGIRCCANDGIAAIINQKLGNKSFLAHLINTKTKDLHDKVATGNGQPNLNTSSIKNVAVPFPPAEEQRAIATALSDVDALLEELDCLIAKKRDIKQAVMQQLLTGQTRLPGFKGEWETVRLGNHVTFLKNGVNSRAELLNDGNVRYLHYGDIHASGASVLNPGSLPFLPPTKAKTLSRVQDGDLIFADASEDIDGVGKSVELINVGRNEVVAGLHTIAARFDSKVLADGFKAYLQFCPEFIEALRRLAAGTKVYATTRSHIAGIEMRLPQLEEQRAIAAIFSDIDTELEALEQRRAKTAAIKQAMMQELLTGRTRLV